MTQLKQFRPTLEVLEDRSVPSVSAILAGGKLWIDGSASADVIQVSEVNVWQPNQLMPETCLQVSIREGGPFTPQYWSLFSKSAVAQIEVKAGAGDDQITINTSKNTMVYAEDGNDSVRGGAGDDIFRGGNGNDTICGGGGNDQVQGENGTDLLYGDEGHDILRGGDGNDTAWGGSGNDQIFGGRGDDSLYGGLGADSLYGDDGRDFLDGGFRDGERDEMYGGNDGNYDVFRYGWYCGTYLYWDYDAAGNWVQFVWVCYDSVTSIYCDGHITDFS